jgi:hypothetical protein
MIGAAPASAGRLAMGNETLNEAASRVATKAFSTAFNELCEAMSTEGRVDEIVAAYLAAMREQLERHERDARSLERAVKFQR